MSKIDRAEIDYRAGMPYKELAKKYGVTLNTVKCWKTRYKWQSRRCAYGADDRMQVVCTPEPIAKSAHDKMVNSVASNEELTDKRKLFCLYFADCLNATQAYIRAYGGKRVTAQVEGHKLLRIPKIRDEIDRLKQIRLESVMLKADDIIERQMRIAFADMADFVDVCIVDSDDGKVNKTIVRPISEVDGTVIQEVKATKDGVSIKLKDSQKAIDWLTKYFELNPADKHKMAFDNARLDIERKKADAITARYQDTAAPPDPLVLQPVYGGDDDGDN